MVLELDRWQKFIQQALIHSAKGYRLYVHIVLPEEKAHRAKAVVAKLAQRYPEVHQTRGKRYRRKKRGLANMSLLHWDRQILVLRTSGEWTPREHEDQFLSLERHPLLIPVGRLITVKIGRGEDGRRMIASLERSSYRRMRDRILDHIAHRRMEQALHLWEIAQHLPAFAGIVRQMRGLHEHIRAECRRHGVSSSDFGAPRLRAVYRAPSGG